MALPQLMPLESPKKGSDRPRPDCVLLAVYAPFGTDRVLSAYPRDPARGLQPIEAHPLVVHLRAVAKKGIHVAALIDRLGEPTWLVEIPAGRPDDLCITSSWKEDMSSPFALAGFLHRAYATHPSAAIVLALEGHGAGFLPDIDRTQLTTKAITDNGRIDWKVSESNSPALPEVSPILPEVSPILPEVSPILPANHMPMSTWGLGEALRLARVHGVPKISVLHFNNCFNMSVEVLHTVREHAEVATGYINYNFFTAGESYPWVFGGPPAPGSLSALDLARRFADGNRDFLAVKGNHPTVGGVVELHKMDGIASAIDDLARALINAMTGAATPQAREAVTAVIEDAIARARQLDTPNGGGFELETPDELTDIRSLALQMRDDAALPATVQTKARDLAKLLEGIWRYGVRDRPWVDVNVEWNFSVDDMAMNILLPDPLRRGLWDWRSPFYMDNTPDPTKPQVQPNRIDFLVDTSWRDFIDEYHKGIKFKGLMAAKIPEFPIFNREFKPPPSYPPPAPCPPPRPRYCKK